MDYRGIVSLLKKSNLVTKSLLDKAELKVTSREEILGLEYRGGEEVIDSVTGQRGRIDAGSTAYITKV
jgi:hypothetical protein